MAKTQSYRLAGSILYFPNPVEGGDEIPLNLESVAEANRKRAELHGWHARISDTAAIGMADKEGNIIPKAERARIKSERMNELCRFYESGAEDWSRVSEGGGGAVAIAVAAFARHEGITAEEAKGRMERVAAAKARTWKAQLAITERLYPAEVKAIQEERNRTPVELNVAEELAALKGE